MSLYYRPEAREEESTPRAAPRFQMPEAPPPSALPWPAFLTRPPSARPDEGGGDTRGQWRRTPEEGSGDGA